MRPAPSLEAVAATAFHARQPRRHPASVLLCAKRDRDNARLCARHALLLSMRSGYLGDPISLLLSPV
jgi:hypothetical protein